MPITKKTISITTHNPPPITSSVTNMTPNGPAMNLREQEKQITRSKTGRGTVLSEAGGQSPLPLPTLLNSPEPDTTLKPAKSPVPRSVKSSEVGSIKKNKSVEVPLHTPPSISQTHPQTLSQTLSQTHPHPPLQTTIVDPEFDGKTIKLDMVIGFLVNKTKKSFEEEFRHVFEKLLGKIAEDYEIPLEELQENYHLECAFHNRKPRDPASICQATCKNGNPCSKNKKEGYSYCGVHLNVALKNKRPIIRSPSHLQLLAQSTTDDQTLTNLLPPISKPYGQTEDQMTASDLTTNDENVDLEEFEYQGETYLKLGSVIYEYPEELDDNTELADLVVVGNLDKGDKIVFRNQ